MYDGGEEQIERRYRRDFEQERRTERRRATRQRMSLDALRQTPLRNGLIGLAVVGTAAPIAVNRYQQALRVDPSHEQRMTRAPAATRGAVTAPVPAATTAPVRSPRAPR